MIELVREAERKSLNVIALSDLLEGANSRFRKAVIGALAKEGFDLDDPLPSLQHPLEILEAIDWLETYNFGAVWDAFIEALMEAGKTGILVDMRRRAGTPTLPDRRLRLPAETRNARRSMEAP
jgi:hypothetical protein